MGSPKRKTEWTLWHLVGVFLSLVLFANLIAHHIHIPPPLQVLSWLTPSEEQDSEGDSGSELDEVLEGIPEDKVLEHLLVGAVVGGREVGVLEIYKRDSDYLVPLQDFLELISGVRSKNDPNPVISTPLGKVSLEPEDLEIIDGLQYLTQRTIDEKFAVRMAFLTSEFALQFDIPWNGLKESTDETPTPLLPDASPPVLSLSTVRFEIAHETLGGFNRDVLIGTMGGRAAGGIWRTRFDANSSGNASLKEYGWMRTWGQQLTLIGHQRLQLHPFLSSLDLTGAQFAWTNQPIDLFSRNPYSSELLPRRMRSSTTVSGYGPPGGAAELRINDRIVRRRVIGLNGLYEFFDVFLPSRQTARVEVYLYDRIGSLVPIDVHDHSVRGHDLLLPKRAFVVSGGFGVQGNPAEQPSGAVSERRLGGFIQGRWGVSENLTLEGFYQEAFHGRQFFAGLAARIGNTVTFSLGGATSNGSFGYDLDLDARGRNWNIMMRSRYAGPGFYGGFVERRMESTSDHFLEAGYRPSQSLAIGLIGHFRSERTRSIGYILPYFSWVPIPQFSVRARPDFWGDYRIDAFARLNDEWRLAFNRSSRHTLVEASRRIAPSLRLTLQTDFLDAGGHRQAAVVDWFGNENRRFNITAGALLTNGKPGFLTGFGLALRDGLALHLNYASESLFSAPSDYRDVTRDSRFFASLTADLALSGRRITAGNSMSGFRQLGGVSGTIELESVSARRIDLGGATILVDGTPRTHSDPDGSFFIQGLSPGIHKIELSPDNLPLELTPRRTMVVANVAPAAMTRVEFTVVVEYGIAGRVVDSDGEPLPNLIIELLRPDNTVVSVTRTDRFGLYRMDEVPIGSFTLRLNPDQAEVPHGGVSRSIEISDDFLFDQDLRLP